MKYLLLLLTTFLIAQTHNFPTVNFNGKTLKNVTLVFDKTKHIFNIYVDGKLLKKDKYMIVNCPQKEKFCLVDNESSYGWLE